MAISRTEKLREELAARIADSLGKGIVPWQKKDLPEMPVQKAFSGKSYSGLNAMYLMERCAEKGYTDPRFVTMSEANKNGLAVKKGEHGVTLEYWKEGSNGKITPRHYTVFNVSQLEERGGKIPDMPPRNIAKELKEIPRGQESDLLKEVEQRLKNAGIDVRAENGLTGYQNAIKKLTVKNAEKMGIDQNAHTPELLALRYSIASTTAMREAGIPVEQTDGTPTKSWASSIRHDPSQLAKAVRDGGTIANSIIRDMTQSHDAELFRANQERAEAQKGQELVSEAATVPRGMDSNLRNADLSGTQEAVIAASDKAATQVNDMRASASSREANAGTSRFAEAKVVAQKELGKGARVTSPTPGRAYTGKIIGTLGDKSAIQAVSDNHAVLHDIKDISAKSNLKIGESVTLTANGEGFSEIQGRGSESKSQKHEKTRDGHTR